MFNALTGLLLEIKKIVYGNIRINFFNLSNDIVVGSYP